MPQIQLSRLLCRVAFCLKFRRLPCQTAAPSTSALSGIQNSYVQAVLTYFWEVLPAGKVASDEKASKKKQRVSRGNLAVPTQVPSAPPPATFTTPRHFVLSGQVWPAGRQVIANVFRGCPYRFGVGQCFTKKNAQRPWCQLYRAYEGNAAKMPTGLFRCSEPVAAAWCRVAA